VRTLTLTIHLAEGVHPDDVATDLNAEVLCRLEEDDKKITGWKYSDSDNYVVRYGGNGRVLVGSLAACSSYIQAHTKHQFTIEKEK
jgi:hypothetical protein